MLLAGEVSMIGCGKALTTEVMLACSTPEPAAAVTCKADAGNIHPCTRQLTTYFTC